MKDAEKTVSPWALWGVIAPWTIHFPSTEDSASSWVFVLRTFSCLRIHQGFLCMLSDITATVQPSLAFSFGPLQISKYGLVNFSDGDGIILHRPTYDIPYVFNLSMTLMTCTV